MKTCIVLASAIDDAALGATSSDALMEHLANCTACAARLERRRALARRIDHAVESYVRVELPPGLPDRIGARVSGRRPPRWRALRFGVPALVALAAGLIIFVSLHGTRTTARPADIAALAAWRSPTASLLVSRSVRAGTHRFHS